MIDEALEPIYKRATACGLPMRHPCFGIEGTSGGTLLLSLLDNKTHKFLIRDKQKKKQR